jgi:formamidopyrimidine-DNA glycosylase
VPELPEVEVVRRGLARWVTGRSITTVEVRHPRPVRRHLPGPDDFAARLRGVTVQDVVRRGKFLWLSLDSGEALMAHLGMSGQLVLEPPDAPDEAHLRVRIGLAGGDPPLGRELRFIDQRMFGGLSVEPLVPTVDGRPGGWGGASDPGSVPAGVEPLVPEPVVHIARDALDPDLDAAVLAARVRRRRTGLKRALLDQTLVSGIGNIYADEALWQAKLHFARPTDTLSRPAFDRVLAASQDVMREALRAGGTSFDSLYVDVNGQSGYFERSLAVYGREGLPCPRCETPVKRATFMNRSSHWCPRCQPRPRNGRW